MVSVPPGTILLDSVNLSPAAGKVTPRDVACISLLESRFPDLPAHNAIYEALQAAKFDVSGLYTCVWGLPSAQWRHVWG